MDMSELRSLYLFEGLTDPQLAELGALGTEVKFEDGEVLFSEGEPADFWWVLLEGRIDLLRRMEHEVSVVGALDRPGVWAGGFRAWTETAGYMASGRGGTPGRVLRVPSEALGAAVQAWFPFGVHLIKGFFQTVRNMEAMARQRAGLVALGTLAAGLAHELNNPAAAASRAADALRDTCHALQAALVGLAEGSLSAEQFVALDGLRREIDAPTVDTDSLSVARHEDELLVWLEDRGVEDAWRIAPPLAAAGADSGWCDRVAQVLDERTLAPGFDWIANSVATSVLLSEVGESTGRVSALVGAVRSYSQLDRASTQLTDVTECIESTLMVLTHKLGDGVRVVRNFAPDLPRIEAKPGELNQVWTNLIDNAVDAMDGTGTLRLFARVEDDHLVVEVGDDGAGMPPEVQARVFEPFFTTKSVGKGTGLGLDISHRIVVDGHHGTIDVASVPGDTVMTVRLPLKST